MSLKSYNDATPALLFPSVAFIHPPLISLLIEWDTRGHAVLVLDTHEATTQSHLLVLLMCDIGHLPVESMWEMCVRGCPVLGRRWHRGRAPATCCCRDFAESSCRQAEGAQDPANNPAPCSSCPFLLPALDKCHQRLIRRPFYVTRLLHRCGSGSRARVTGAWQSLQRGENHRWLWFTLEITFKTLCVWVSKNKTLQRDICSCTSVILWLHFRSQLKGIL